MDKPIIILGGGFWGGLLAWRLKETQPGIQFKLVAENSILGNHQSCSFRESDCEPAMKWIKPLIYKSWEQHHIKCRTIEKWVTNPYHLLDSQKFHDQIAKRLGDDLILNNRMTVEHALQSGSFVIDTRNICHYKKTAYRKWISLEVELTEDHHLIAPVVFDTSIEFKKEARHLYYLPVNERKLLIKDFWISESKKINCEEMRSSLLEVLKFKGWKIGKVIKEDYGSSEFPLSAPVIRQEGRVLNLASLFHDTTGCSIPAATRLIDRMVKTSFRMGELKEVLKNFRKEEEADRKFFRFLNSQIVLNQDSRVFDAVYSQPYSLIERFSKGKLHVLDRSRITLGRSAFRVSGLMNMVLPYSIQPGIQYRDHKSV